MRHKFRLPTRWCFADIIIIMQELPQVTSIKGYQRASRISLVSFGTVSNIDGKPLNFRLAHSKKISIVAQKNVSIDLLDEVGHSDHFIQKNWKEEKIYLKFDPSRPIREPFHPWSTYWLLILTAGPQNWKKLKLR